MSKDQKNFLSTLLGNNTNLASDTLSGLLQSDGAGFEDQFQKGVVDPAMKTYNQQILPGIQERFVDQNAGSSSALNQALVSSAGDLSNILGGQRIQYQQGQQGLRQQAQMGALGQIMQLMNAKQFQPIVQGPQGGMLKDLIAGGSSIAAGAASNPALLAMLSSRTVKKNIRDYDKGLETVRHMDVKQYDYTVDVEGRKNNRVGLIAEDLPSELQAQIDGIKGVDLYGLVSTLVNAVKELDAKVKQLEAA